MLRAARISCASLLSCAPLILCAAALGIACAPPAAAIDTAAMREQMESFLVEAYPADEPGAAVIVTRDGEVLFRDAFGMADLELGVPLAPDMVFRLGSITKQFTGAAIALLEQEGKLSVDDPITEFLPDYPTHGHEITVAHLLAHTSGIRSYTGIPGWMQTKIKQDMTIDELIDGFESEPMDFAPGARYRYNNSGYVLLGAIIEKASGMSYEEFVERRIFAPLEMTSSDYGAHARIIPRRARGYARTANGWENAQYLSMTQPYAAGSLLSTVDDLAKWDRSLYTDDLLSDEARRKMVTSFTLADGSAIDYGYGFALGDLRGHPSVSHGGGIFGFSTFAIRLPEERVYVAVLTNRSGGGRFTPAYVARKLAAIAIDDPFPDFTPVTLPEDVLEQYTGVYRINDTERRLVLLIDGRLYTQRTGGGRTPVTPFSDTEFFYDNSFTHIEFVKDAGGAVTHMLAYQDGAKTPERAERTGEPLPETQAVAVDPEILAGYVGAYELADAGLTLTITLDGGKLYGQAQGQPRIELTPTSETEFVVERIGARLVFARGPDGRATHLMLYQGGAEMRGTRVE